MPLPPPPPAARCDNGIVVHRDWSQLKEMREGVKQTRGVPRGKRAGQQDEEQQQQQGEQGVQGGQGGQQQGGHQPFMGFNVEIQVQKVRNKTTGMRGRALLEYDAASGRYHEVGQGPAHGAAATAGAAAAAGAAGAGAGQVPLAAGGGEEGRWSYAREGLGEGLDVEDLEEWEEGEEEEQELVDDALLDERRDGEVLSEVTRRQIEVINLMEEGKGARAEQEQPEWTQERDEVE